MNGIKMILFGIGILIFAIFCVVMGIDYNYSRFVEYYLPITLSIVGAGFMIVGMFFVKD